jgi:hypothetical protein
MLWFENKLDRVKAEALQVVQQTIDSQSSRLETLRNSLCKTAEAATARWEAKNERGTMLSLKKFRALRADYETLIIHLAKLEELYNEIALGEEDDLVERQVESVQAHFKFVQGYQKHITTILNQSCAQTPCSDDDLLDELVSGQVQRFVQALATA